MEILNTIGTVLAGLLMLTVLVVIHEGGHFAVGRACGIRINEFSVGFGPKLFSRKKGEIAYSVRALPLGGFVQFYGEEEMNMQQMPRQVCAELKVTRRTIQGYEKVGLAAPREKQIRASALR